MMPQMLLSHINGTSIAPPATIEANNELVSNPVFFTWTDFDQKVVILLNPSFTEEAVVEVLDLSTSHAIWSALQTAYNNSFIECIHSLQDSLHQMTKGTTYIFDYARKFKTCDKLTAIGQPVEEMDKIH